MTNARAALALCAILAGCGAPGPQPPAAQARLETEGARAASQARAGDHAGAARRYEEALRIARTLDDADAVAVNSLNLSIVYARLGREADAKAVLGPLLADERNAYPPARRTQAELRMAIMTLAAREHAAAAAWAARAQARCESSGCAQMPAILNVMAQSALETGRPADAATLAYAALDRARQADERVEMGNALRLVGRALRAQGDAAGAIKALEQAWEIDRGLADPRKIMADLLELAHANLAAGNKEAARDYQQRAAAISRSLQNGK
jgi:tetratricopeptide (TPR) repeat protein